MGLDCVYPNAQGRHIKRPDNNKSRRAVSQLHVTSCFLSLFLTFCTIGHQKKLQCLEPDLHRCTNLFREIQ